MEPVRRRPTAAAAAAAATPSPRPDAGREAQRAKRSGLMEGWVKRALLRRLCRKAMGQGQLEAFLSPEGVTLGGVAKEMGTRFG